ncbi:endo-1,4-beta-xylanase [Cellulomonas sp. NPDC089187]|uniref:endo-1,4-beta-xylanase n=1 Tax=Cellulomonas sp. NPDC089187 TaxID=3154970 RepID=UPI003439B824
MRRPGLILGVLALAAAALALLLLLRDPAPPAPTPAPPTPTAPTEALTGVLSTGFDDPDQGTTGWEPLGEGVGVERSGQVPAVGTGSLLVTGRTETWHGAQVDVTGVVSPGVRHTVTAAVRLGQGGGDDPGEQRHGQVQLTLQRTGGDEQFWHIASAEVTADAWATVTGAVELPADATDGQWRLYLESTDTLADLRLDEVQMARPTPPVQKDIPALSAATDTPLGVAVAGQDLSGRPAELLLRHFDQLTAENAMKPAVVQPVEGEFDFEPMDQILDFAVAHDLTVHGHTLVWHKSTPDWFFTSPDGRPLTDDPADQQLLRDRMRAHLQAVADHLTTRYGADNPVDSWDVVNEPLDPTQPDGLRHSRWYDILGPDYIAEAFAIARGVFGPEVTLYLNDYDTDAPDRRRALLSLLDDLRTAGAPVDAVGHQMHLRLGSSVDRVNDTLDAVAAAGFRQAITELDVALTPADQQLSAVTAEQLDAQGDLVEDLVDVFMAHDPEFVSVWGLYDTRSWLRTWPRDRPLEAPLLFDDELQAKPAYRGFLAGLTG